MHHLRTEQGKDLLVDMLGGCECI